MEIEIEVVRASVRDIQTLVEWRMRVLAEVFSLPEDPEDADIEPLRVANERYYAKHLSDGSHTACLARARGTGISQNGTGIVQDGMGTGSFAGDAGQIVGCGGICYQEEMPSPDNPSGTCGYLMNIYALPNWRGRGIGRRIVEFLVQDARERGTGKIYLETSEAGRALYESLGFFDMRGYMKL